MEKKIGKKIWLSYGRVCGFSVGFQISKLNCDLSLGFWYVGLEY